MECDDEQLILERLFPNGLQPARFPATLTVVPGPEEAAGTRYGAVDEDALDGLLDQGVITIVGLPGILVPSRERRTVIRWEFTGAAGDGGLAVAGRPASRKRAPWSYLERPRDGWLLRREHTQLVFRLKPRKPDGALRW